MAKKKKSRRAHARRRHTFATNPTKRRRHRRHKVMVNPSRRRKYRRNPGDSMKDIAVMVGSGVAAAILGPKLASKLPGSLLVKNLALIAAGAALAFLGRKKNVLVGLGAGLVVAGATRALSNAVPALAGDNEFNGEEQQAILQHLAGDELNGPMDGDDYLNGPMDGDDFLNGPMDGDDYLNGPMDGDELLGAEMNQASL